MKPRHKRLAAIALGVGRLGFLVTFLSRPVLSGFTSAAAILKAANPTALDHCLIGHVSAEPGHIRAIEKLGIGLGAGRKP